MASTAVKFQPEELQSLAKEISEKSGQNLMACYQCKRCAAGCPVSGQTDNFTPNKLIRTIVMGDRDAMLNNELIWKCVSCYTCGTRCPNDIQTARLTETIKKIAKEEHANVRYPKVANFHKAFVGSAVRWGRINEIEFMGSLAIKNSIDILKDMDLAGLFREHLSQAMLGKEMMSKKRMHFGFQTSKGRSEIKRLMNKAEQNK